MTACELIDIELALDRIEGELAGELPAYLRSVAAAYARRAPLPPPPPVMLAPTSAVAAQRALSHPILADRGLALLRLVAPAQIDADPAVGAAYAAAPSWAALAALAAARDRAARNRFDRSALAVGHRLHGIAPPHVGSTGVPPGDLALPPPVAGWHDEDGIVLDRSAISQLWDRMRAQHAIDGAVRFERSASARPRTFVIAPRAEVVVVIPERVTTPVARFSVVHELGHVLAALVLPAGVPRLLDEAAAAYVARSVEEPGSAFSPLAAAARTRRLALARVLDAIERGLPALPAQPITAQPPWALWHDPGAQAAYVAAEALADQIAADAGPHPAPGALAAVLASHRDRIDRVGF